jgi:hypothetical protein
MNFWDELLIALGGNAALLIVLGFLARSLLQTWLSRDIKNLELGLKAKGDAELERLKADLKAQGEISNEQLKSHLQQTAFQHQVRFSKLHDKRGEVIEQLYEQLVEAEKGYGRFVLVDGFDNDIEKQAEARRKTETTMYEVSFFIEKNRIYLSAAICELLKTFLDIMWNNVINVGAYTFKYPTPNTIQEKHAALRAAYEALRKEIPPARAVLEDEFRNILGVK